MSGDARKGRGSEKLASIDGSCFIPSSSSSSSNGSCFRCSVTWQEVWDEVGMLVTFACRWCFQLPQTSTATAAAVPGVAARHPHHRGTTLPSFLPDSSCYLLAAMLCVLCLPWNDTGTWRHPTWASQWLLQLPSTTFPVRGGQPAMQTFNLLCLSNVVLVSVLHTHTYDQHPCCQHDCRGHFCWHGISFRI